MTWKTLVDDGRAEPHVATKDELNELRMAVRRNLDDAAIDQLSADNRFGIAYQAALLSAKMAIAGSGYRVKGPGAHQTTFRGLKIAMGPSVSTIANYFDRCRRKRNDLVYESEGIVSVSDADELLAKAEQFHATVERWIATHHPKLA